MNVYYIFYDNMTSEVPPLIRYSSFVNIIYYIFILSKKRVYK